MPRRKVRDEVEARQFLEAVACSGLPRAEWARRHGIDGRSLNAWRLALERRDRKRDGIAKPLEFLELVPTVPVASRPTARSLELRVQDVQISVPADFDDRHLQRVLRAVLAC